MDLHGVQRVPGGDGLGGGVLIGFFMDVYIYTALEATEVALREGCGGRL